MRWTLNHRSMFTDETFPRRATGPATPTDTPSCGRSRGTRAKWRSLPPSRRSRLTRTATPLGSPSSSYSSGSREKRHVGSIHLTATPRSAWRAERSATTAGQPRWEGKQDNLVSNRRKKITPAAILNVTLPSSVWTVKYCQSGYYKFTEKALNSLLFAVDEGGRTRHLDPDRGRQSVHPPQHRPQWGSAKKKQSE